MGWWQQDDGTVIGDEMADIVGGWLNQLAGDFLKVFPRATKAQLLNTLAFTTSYIKVFDHEKVDHPDDDVLTPMLFKQQEKWRETHSVPPNMSIRVAPNTPLVNVKNPFKDEAMQERMSL